MQTQGTWPSGTIATFIKAMEIYEKTKYIDMSLRSQSSTLDDCYGATTLSCSANSWIAQIRPRTFELRNPDTSAWCDIHFAVNIR